jgi:hypothetical protein
LTIATAKFSSLSSNSFLNSSRFIYIPHYRRFFNSDNHSQWQKHLRSIGRERCTIAFRAAKWEIRVRDVGLSSNQSITRLRLIAHAVRTCWRWVFAKPRYRVVRIEKAFVAQDIVPFSERSETFYTSSFIITLFERWSMLVLADGFQS